MSNGPNRISRRRRAALSEDAHSVMNNTINTVLRPAFAPESADKRHMEMQIGRVLPKPQASAQDPASVLLIIYFWMCQTDYVLARSSTMQRQFIHSGPWNHFSWSTKTIGDIHSTLLHAQNERFRALPDRPFVEGRDGLGTWIYIRWSSGAEDWLKDLWGATSVLASVKQDRALSFQPHAFLMPSGISPILETLTRMKAEAEPIEALITYAENGLVPRIRTSANASAPSLSGVE